MREEIGINVPYDCKCCSLILNFMLLKSIENIYKRTFLLLLITSFLHPCSVSRLCSNGKSEKNKFNNRFRPFFFLMFRPRIPLPLVFLARTQIYFSVISFSALFSRAISLRFRLRLHLISTDKREKSRLLFLIG